MKFFVTLAAILAAASGAPTGYDVAPAVAVAPAAGVAYAHAAAPVAAHVPAPYTTSAVHGAPTETVHQPAPVISKQLHFGQTEFISGYQSLIHKPPTPELPIAVPTALKGSVSYNAPIVKVQKEAHVVHEPYTVEKRVEVPYDVPVVREQVVEVPVPVHVDQPYAVEHPVPVQGEPIVNVRRGPAQVYRTHEHRVAQPVVHAVAQPVAHAVAVEGYAAAPAAATYGYNLGAYGLDNAYGYAAGLAHPVAAATHAY